MARVAEVARAGAGADGARRDGPHCAGRGARRRAPPGPGARVRLRRLRLRGARDRRAGRPAAARAAARPARHHPARAALLAALYACPFGTIPAGAAAGALRRAGPDALAAAAAAALGGCHADHLEALAEELAPLSQEYSGERAKARARLRRRPARHLPRAVIPYPTLSMPSAGRARARAARGRAPGGRGGLAPGGRRPAARRAALAQPAHAFLGLPGRHARAAGQRRARCAQRRPPPRRPPCALASFCKPVSHCTFWVKPCLPSQPGQESSPGWAEVWRMTAAAGGRGRGLPGGGGAAVQPVRGRARGRGGAGGRGRGRAVAAAPP